MSHIATNINETQTPFRSQLPAPAADAHGAPMFAAQRPPPWSFWRHRCEGRGPAWAEGPWERTTAGNVGKMVGNKLWDANVLKGWEK
jgi:hypothetical protein